jgi:hypothetical protein
MGLTAIGPVLVMNIEDEALGELVVLGDDLALLTYAAEEKDRNIEDVRVAATLLGVKVTIIVDVISDKV